jgi:hypothetical protein
LGLRLINPPETAFYAMNIKRAFTYLKVASDEGHHVDALYEMGMIINHEHYIIF